LRINLTSTLVACAMLAGCSAPESSVGSRAGGDTRGAARSPTGDLSASGASAPQLTASTGPLVMKDPTVVTALGPKVCASAVVQSSKVPPTVAFVIDGSGSMCAPYGAGGTRWQALRTALLDPAQGLIYRLQSSVNFSVLLYDGTLNGGGPPLAGGGATAQNPACALVNARTRMGGPGPGGGLPGPAGALGAANLCPQLIEVAPMLDNAAAIDMAYPTTELGGSTPTDRAVNYLMDKLSPMVGMQAPDGEPPGDIFVILATDGAPNSMCLGAVPGLATSPQDGVVAAVQRGADAGIITWTISLADGDPELQAHLDNVARAGNPNDPGAHTFVPNNPDDLIQTLAQLLGGAIGCDISLRGTVTVGAECRGTVSQNGQPLPCCQADAQGALSCDNQPAQDPSGWRLSSPSTIELLGQACTDFLLGTSQLIDASFPCEVFSPQ